MFNCHLQNINKDIYFASLENNKYDFIKIDDKEIQDYWKKRLIGEGTY